MEKPVMADVHCLRAAEGWLELGDPASAVEELTQLSAVLKQEPATLNLYFSAYASMDRWDEAAGAARELTYRKPDDYRGWLHYSYALHELKRTQEAFDQLVKVINRFPEVAVLHYNLACYECQLGNLQHARVLLDTACKLPGGDEFAHQALSDPDLAPLYPEAPRPG